MKQFVAEALQEKLANGSISRTGAKPEWMKYFGTFGKTAQMCAETRRIQKIIDKEFESLDSEDEA